MNITAEQACKIANSCVKVVSYETKMKKIEERIIDHANHHLFKACVALQGETFTMTDEDIYKIKKNLEANGFKTKIWNKYLNISWENSLD